MSRGQSNSNTTTTKEEAWYMQARTGLSQPPQSRVLGQPVSTINKLKVITKLGQSLGLIQVYGKLKNCSPSQLEYTNMIATCLSQL